MPMASNLAALHIEYQAAVERGDKARVAAIENTVVSENYGLVQKLVGKLIRRLVGGFTGEEADLMQAGAIGLVTAWQRWDPKKGALSTYAGHWVRHEVQEALGNDQAIYKPRQMGKPWPVHKAQETFKAKRGRDANATELLAELDLVAAQEGEEKVPGVMRMAKVVGMKDRDYPAKDAAPEVHTAFRDHVILLTAKRIEDWRQAPAMQSLDDMMQGGQTHENDLRNLKGTDNNIQASARAEKLLTDRKPTPAEAYERAELAALAQRGFESLTKVEQYVMQQLFMEDRPYKVVAAALGCSEEYVRQYRKSAIDKLKECVEA